MINEKETLKNWHQTNPSLTIDDLLGLLDGIVTTPNLTVPSQPYNPITVTYKDNTPVPPYTVTCSK